MDFLGTVKIYAPTSGGTIITSPTTTMPVITITPVVGNVVTPVVPTASIFKKLIYVILTGLFLMGAIIYFSIKKAKWILAFVGLVTVGLAFSIYQFFKKQNEESKIL